MDMVGGIQAGLLCGKWGSEVMQSIPKHDILARFQFDRASTLPQCPQPPSKHPHGVE